MAELSAKNPIAILANIKPVKAIPSKSTAVSNLFTAPGIPPRAERILFIIIIIFLPKSSTKKFLIA